MSLRRPWVSTIPYRLRRCQSSVTSNSRRPGGHRGRGSTTTPCSGPCRSSRLSGSRRATAPLCPRRSRSVKDMLHYHRRPRCGRRSRAGRGAGGARFSDYTLPMPGTAAPRWRFLVTPRWLAWHLVMAGSVYGMLALGDWQLHRAMSGNALSWAYTFEWAVFAVFAVVFWAKTIRDEFHPPAVGGRPAQDVLLPAGAVA